MTERRTRPTVYTCRPCQRSAITQRPSAFLQIVMNWVLVTVLMGSPLVNASCPDGLIEHASRIWSIHNGKVEVHFVILSQQHSNAQLEGGDGQGGCREHVRQGQVGGDSTAVSIFVDICRYIVNSIFLQILRRQCCLGGRRVIFGYFVPLGEKRK